MYFGQKVFRFWSGQKVQLAIFNKAHHSIARLDFQLALSPSMRECTYGNNITPFNTASAQLCLTSPEVTSLRKKNTLLLLGGRIATRLNF